MLTFPTSFKLIENGIHLSAAQLSQQSAKSDCDHIQVSESQCEPHNDTVTQMLRSVFTAQNSDIPVIFNRKNQTINQPIPKNFCIGLYTSGTTGEPKLVFHSLQLILPKNKKHTDKLTRWLLCYHPMSFAGLQVILQAFVCGDVLVSDTQASIANKAKLALIHQITAISATPSLFRALLLSWVDDLPPLELLSFGGETCDQSTLDASTKAFPEANIRHIYATTEAGVIFSVSDGKAGFPAHWLESKKHGTASWILSLVDGILHLSNEKQHVNTGDCVTLDHDRAIFTGREDNLINVGGVKINLEEIERNICQLEGIKDARVFAKANPITGALICVEIDTDNRALAKQVLSDYSKKLPATARPRIIQFPEKITLTEMSKKQRRLL